MRLQGGRTILERQEALDADVGVLQRPAAPPDDHGVARGFPGMDIRRQLAASSATRSWLPSSRAIYLLFCDRMIKDQPLIITAGAGGLRFDKRLEAGFVLVCRVDASRCARAADRYVVTFQRDVMEAHLDIHAAIAAMRDDLGPESLITVGAELVGVHFPQEQTIRVADTVATHIVARLA